MDKPGIAGSYAACAIIDDGFTCINPLLFQKLFQGIRLKRAMFLAREEIIPWYMHCPGDFASEPFQIRSGINEGDIVFLIFYF